MSSSSGNVGYHFNSGGWAWRSFNHAEGQYHAWYKNSNAEIMRLNTTGLGVGTSSPAQTLDVNGNAVIGSSGEELKMSWQNDKIGRAHV